MYTGSQALRLFALSIVKATSNKQNKFRGFSLVGRFRARFESVYRLGWLYRWPHVGGFQRARSAVVEDCERRLAVDDVPVGVQGLHDLFGRWVNQITPRLEKGVYYEVDETVLK